MQNENAQHDHYNDEIDLFELVATIWKGKWLILGCVILTLIVAVAYIKVTPTKYQIEVPYTVQLHSLESQQLCGGNYSCLDSETKKQLARVSKNSKKLSSGSFFSIDSSEGQVASQRLKVAAIDLTLMMKNQAQIELDLIVDHLPSQLMQTERVATNYLNAQRLLNKIANGAESVIVAEPTVTKASPKINLIVALSVVLGGMLGVFLVFVRVGIASYQKRQSA